MRVPARRLRSQGVGVTARGKFAILVPMSDIAVTFAPEQHTVQLPAGITGIEAAGAAGILVNTPCGGQGQCGKCRVRFLTAAPEPTPAERELISADDRAAGWRLGCQTRLRGAATIEIPASSRPAETQILVQGVAREVAVEPVVGKRFLSLPRPSLDDQRPDLARVLAALDGSVGVPRDVTLLREMPARLRQADFRVTAVLCDGDLIDVEPGDTTGANYGCAFDIGTTTLVGYLLDLSTGRQLAVASALNPQVTYGEDVVSRINFAMSRPDGLAVLHQSVVGAINELIDELLERSGVPRQSVYEIAAVGNTCMTHLLLGVSPEGLAATPFAPAIGGAQWLPASEIGLRIHPRGRLLVLPNIAGFVGSDTVGVILASRLDESAELRVAVDIGTNGEVVAVRGRRMVACSTAAGPAFEGARIRYGMRAAAGAIDRADFNGDLRLHTIGEEPPRGLCGSGLLDVVAALRQAGLITEAGRLLDDEAATAAGVPAHLRARLRGSGAETEFLLAETPPGNGVVTLTAQDVRQLQLAKSAISAGIVMAVAELGARPEEIEELLLAGAFGNYLRPESAHAIGLIAGIPTERVRSIGNAAGAGAKLALLSRRLRERAARLVEEVVYVELSDRKEFYEHFAEVMPLRPKANPG